jgi:hypothetical protein
MPASQYGESPHLPFHSSTGFRLQHCELTLDGAKAALPRYLARQQGKAKPSEPRFPPWTQTKAYTSE